MDLGKPDGVGLFRGKDGASLGKTIAQFSQLNGECSFQLGDVKPGSRSAVSGPRYRSNAAVELSEAADFSLSGEAFDHALRMHDMQTRAQLTLQQQQLAAGQQLRGKLLDTETELLRDRYDTDAEQQRIISDTHTTAYTASKTAFQDREQLLTEHEASIHAQEQQSMANINVAENALSDEKLAQAKRLHEHTEHLKATVKRFQNQTDASVDAYATEKGVNENG